MGPADRVTVAWSPAISDPSTKYRALSSRWAGLIVRAVWWTMLLLHVVVLAFVSVAVTRDGVSMQSVGDVVALLGAIAFFYFKARDVAWLRIGGRTKGLVVWALLAALVHPPAFPADGSWAEEIPQSLVAVCTVVAGVAVVTRVMSSRLRMSAPNKPSWRRLWQSDPAPILVRTHMAWDARGPPLYALPVIS